MISIRRPFRRYGNQVPNAPLIRSKSPALFMPMARPMREPGTGYLTYITANGPRTIKKF